MLHRRRYGGFGRRRGLAGIRWIGPNDARYFAWVFVLFVIGYLWAGMSHEPEPTPSAPETGFIIHLYREDTGEIVSFDLEEYLVGVLAAEVPASFHIEALKAQAVAARTFILHRLESEAEPVVPGAVISSDFRRGQGWISEEEYRARWGDGPVDYWARFVEAVEATRGEVLVYDGRPIFAAYHSSSGGHTENSENYWSTVLPYLRGVPDPFDAVSPHRGLQESFAVAELLAELNIEHLHVAGAVPDVEIVDRYPSGRVRSMRIAGVEYTGREVREALGLRSTMFDVEVKGDRIVFRLDGNGHGVGLSQYGANGMAHQGYTYREILSYYYSGVQLVNWYEGVSSSALE